jgi:hypothetical protein
VGIHSFSLLLKGKGGVDDFFIKEGAGVVVDEGIKRKSVENIFKVGSLKRGAAAVVDG